MTQNTTPHDVSKTRVVYAMSTSDAVRIRRDEEYRVTDEGALTITAEEDAEFLLVSAT